MIKTQFVNDSNGAVTGVFLPIKDWENIKAQYPDIELINDDLPQWEKELIDIRLNDIAKNPEILQPIENLFSELRRKI
jgi:hypothetical protein